MGNFRIVIDAVGGHGQDRDRKDGETVDFTHNAGYHNNDTPEAIAKRAVEELKAKGTNILSAKVYHWPSDTVYQGDPVAPVDGNGKECITDDLLTSVRKGQF